MEKKPLSPKQVAAVFFIFLFGFLLPLQCRLNPSQLESAQVPPTVAPEPTWASTPAIVQEATETPTLAPTATTRCAPFFRPNCK
jgi:hypothetical protein